MSLYEPSIRESRWSMSQRFSRPTTTLEGWKELGLGVYAMKSNIRIFSIRHQFDLEQYRNDGLSTIVSDEPEAEEKKNEEELPSGLRAQSALSYGHLMRPPGSVVPAVPPKTLAVMNPGSDNGKKPENVQNDENIEREYDQTSHAFSQKQKWLVVGMVVAAGVLPLLTQIMYYPGINTVAQDLHQTLEGATLTISSYLVVQGIAALFWGPLSETFGRRPVYLGSLLLCTAANLVLSFSPNYAVLSVFRGVQAAGVTSTVCIGGAVIHDISSKVEGQTFLNFYQGARNAGLIFAPLLGGLITQFSNFRTVFIFLLSVTLAVLATLALFMPETLPGIAGSGTVQLTGIYKPLAYRLRILPEPEYQQDRRTLATPPGLDFKSFLDPVLLLAEKDIVLNLTCGAIVYTLWLMVTVSTAGLFRKAFGTDDLLIGLSFIPNFVGTIVGSTLMGNLLNDDILTAFAKHKARHALPPSAKLSVARLPDHFKLEHTRLRRLPWVQGLFTVCLTSYGFTLAYPAATRRPGWILLPLFLQFVIAATAHAVCAIHQTLASDLWYQSGHASTAAGNLMRCFFGALGVGLIQWVLDNIGAWSTFVALGLVVMVLVPLPAVQWYWGADWRAEREAAKTIRERVEKTYH